MEERSLDKLEVNGCLRKKRRRLFLWLRLRGHSTIPDAQYLDSWSIFARKVEWHPDALVYPGHHSALRMLRIDRFAMTHGKTMSNRIVPPLNPTYSCIDSIRYLAFIFWNRVSGFRALVTHATSIRRVCDVHSLDSSSSATQNYLKGLKTVFWFDHSHAMSKL